MVAEAAEGEREREEEGSAERVRASATFRTSSSLSPAWRGPLAEGERTRRTLRCPRLPRVPFSPPSPLIAGRPSPPPLSASTGEGCAVEEGEEEMAPTPRPSRG
jgi:hypothetical protein